MSISSLVHFRNYTVYSDDLVVHSKMKRKQERKGKREASKQYKESVYITHKKELDVHAIRSVISVGFY